MAVTDEVVVRAALRDDLTRPLRLARAEVDRTTRSLSNLSRTDRTLNGLRRTLRGVDTQLRSTSRTLGDFVGRQVQRAGVAFGTLTALAGGFGLRAASSFEQDRIAFDGLLGSVEAGKRLFEDLQRLNLKTPFELSDITGGARQLLGFQFSPNQVTPLLRAATDAAAGLGAGSEGLQRILLNLGQVQAQGKVTGRELRDFATIGFPGYALVADILGKSREEIKAMGDDAEVSSDQFIRAVINMQGPLQIFGGMAEKQQKSLRGLWSNIKDLFTIGMAEAASQPGGLVDTLRPMLQPGGAIHGGLQSLLTTVGPPMGKLLGMVASFVGQAMPLVGPLLATVVDGVGRLLSAAQPAFTALMPIADELTGSLIELVDELVPVMPELVDAFVAMVGVLPDFVRLLGDMVPLVSPLARLTSELLEFEPASKVAAGLLVVLLGYRALGPIAAGLYRFAGGMRAVTAANIAAAGAGGAAGVAGAAGAGAAASAAGRRGLLGRLGRVVLPVAVGTELANWIWHDSALSDPLKRSARATGRRLGTLPRDGVATGRSVTVNGGIKVEARTNASPKEIAREVPKAIEEYADARDRRS